MFDLTDIMVFDLNTKKILLEETLIGAEKYVPFGFRLTCADLRG